jgi:mannose-6-phosphate isomerase-like protein (cupin superfamily)
MTRVLTLHDGEQLTIRSCTPELLDMAAEWKPADRDIKPPFHYHPLQDEHFEIHEGELTVKLASETTVLRSGDSLDVPRGTPHAMWNSGGSVTRGTWQVRPALRTEQFFTAVHAMRAAGAAGKGGMITMPAAGMIFKAFPDEFCLVMPELARRPAIALLAAIGRLRGYPRVSRKSPALDHQ